MFDNYIWILFSSLSSVGLHLEYRFVQVQGAVPKVNLYAKEW